MLGFPDSISIFGTSRGKILDTGQMALGVSRLATDTVGNFTMTLTNVVAGSSIQVETTAGAPVQFASALTTDVVMSIPVYASGSGLNNLRVKVRKGSTSPYYQPWETQTTSFVGSQTLFVSQIPDE